jgi:hypothetical protein
MTGYAADVVAYDISPFHSWATLHRLVFSLTCFGGNKKHGVYLPPAKLMNAAVIWPEYSLCAFNAAT